MQPTRRETQDEQIPSPAEEAATHNRIPFQFGDPNR